MGNDRHDDKRQRISDVAFERYEALYEQELYREKEKPMWGSEHEQAARRKVYEAVIAECSSPSAISRNDVLEEAAKVCEMAADESDELLRRQPWNEYAKACANEAESLAIRIRDLKQSQYVKQP